MDGAALGAKVAVGPVDGVILGAKVAVGLVDGVTLGAIESLGATEGSNEGALEQKYEGLAVLPFPPLFLLLEPLVGEAKISCCDFPLPFPLRVGALV